METGSFREDKDFHVEGSQNLPPTMENLFEKKRFCSNLDVEDVISRIEYHSYPSKLQSIQEDIEDH